MRKREKAATKHRFQAQGRSRAPSVLINSRITEIGRCRDNKLVSPRVIQKDFESICSLPDESGGLFRWRYVFSLPQYMQVWWEAFHTKGELYLGVVKEEDHLIGVAPLIIEGQSCSFIGSPSVCDYLDFSIVPGKESLFYHSLLDDLDRIGVDSLDLRRLRPESTVLTVLSKIVESRGGIFHRGADGVSVEMDLPQSWNDYLGMLSGKERHELKRKSRRLEQAGPADTRILEKVSATEMELNRFFTMFRQSRRDKDSFMDARMESYFRLLFKSLGEAGVLKLYLLEIKGHIVAASLCFDYEGTVFLYNSCYDPIFKQYSVGLLCNVSTIRNSIEMGFKGYDFLKGDEPYKRRLGGHKVRLSKAQIAMDRGANI